MEAARMMEYTGRLLLIFGAVAVALGAVLLILGKNGVIPRFLPGDIVIRKPGGTLYFPLVTCLVASVVITLILQIIAFIRR